MGLGKWDPTFPYVHTHVRYMKTISIPNEQTQACSCDFVCFLHINYACGNILCFILIVDYILRQMVVRL